MLALLVSSHCIFNVKEKLDSTAINTLGLVVDMIKNIRLSDDERHSDLTKVDAKEFKSLFPAFTVLIRDWYLDMKDNVGREITSDQYLLEKVLVI